MTKRIARCAVFSVAAWIGVMLLLGVGASKVLAQASFNVDPERLAIARKLIDVCGIRKQLEFALPGVLEAQARALMAGQPDFERFMRENPARVNELAKQYAPQAHEAHVLVYARELSLHEANEFIRFCETPIGARIAEKTLSIQRLTATERGHLSTEMVREIGKQIMDKLNPAPPAAQIPPKVDATPLGVPPKTDSRASRPPRNPPPRQDGPAVPESKP